MEEKMDTQTIEILGRNRLINELLLDGLEVAIPLRDRGVDLIHEKAMPVILNGLDEQKLWLEEGDEALLRPYEGELEIAELADTLERLYPEENRKY